MGANLSERVRANAVAQRDPEIKPLSVQLREMEHQFQLAMPAGGEAGQLIRDVMTCLRQTPKLQQCVPATVLGGAMTRAQLGLRPGVPALGHGWLLPFWNKSFEWSDDQGRVRKGALCAQLIIGYQGYADLGNRSGQISSMIARTIYEHDHYDVQYGMDDNLIHRPAMNGPRGQAIGYYSIVRTSNGGRFFEFLSRAEAEAHRDAFAMARTKDGIIIGPWRDHFDAMAKKSAFLKLKPWIPKSTEVRHALVADNTIRVSLDPAMPPDAASIPIEMEQVEPDHYADADIVDEGPPAETP